MKNPEHESGYFEDGSDVEIISEENNTSCAADKKKKSTWDSGSCSIERAINELDVRDSPASPEPNNKSHNRGTYIIQIHIISLHNGFLFFVKK